MSNSASSSRGSSTSSRRKNRGKRWDPIALPQALVDGSAPSEELEDTPLPAGYQLRFFSNDFARMFSCPSDKILCTRGVIDYANEFNSMGPSKTKMKMFMCTLHEMENNCPNGFNCREVHVVHEMNEDGTVKLPDVVISNPVHMRAAKATDHPRLPPGVTFELAQPNMQVPSDRIPSETVFMTKGAKDFFDTVSRGLTPNMNMQHCAHYSKNGLCCFGPDCQFVHVQGYKPPENANGTSETTSSHGDSSLENSMGSLHSSSSNRSASKRSSKTKETPLSFTDESQRGVAPTAQTLQMLQQQHQPVQTQQQPAAPPGGRMFMPTMFPSQAVPAGGAPPMYVQQQHRPPQYAAQQVPQYTPHHLQQQQQQQQQQAMYVLVPNPAGGQPQLVMIPPGGSPPQQAFVPQGQQPCAMPAPVLPLPQQQQQNVFVVPQQLGSSSGSSWHSSSNPTVASSGLSQFSSK